MRSLILILLIAVASLTACTNPLQPVMVCPTLDHLTYVIDADGNPMTVEMWKYPNDPYFYAHAPTEKPLACRPEYR